MFDACFVHDEIDKKHPLITGIHTGDWHTFSKWKKFKDLKTLKSSKIWKQESDLRTPIYFPHSDYCPVCTRSSRYEIIPDEPIVWRECLWCKDSLNCEWSDDFDFKKRDFYVIAHKHERPIIFQFMRKQREDEQECLDEVKEIMKEL